MKRHDLRNALRRAHNITIAKLMHDNCDLREIAKEDRARAAWIELELPDIERDERKALRDERRVKAS